MGVAGQQDYRSFSRSMLKYSALIAATILPTVPTLAAEVFFDDFNRATLDGAYTTTVTGGSDGAGAINGSTFLELTNDAGAAANVNGRVSCAVALSSFAAPFSSTLSANASLVTWETNLRYNRATDPSGFGGGNYGTAFVLAGTQADFTTGSGYAVVYGSVASPEPLRFVRYTGGLVTGGTVTDLISGPALTAVNNYASLRVTYAAATNNWALYVRDDGASAWADAGTLTGTNQIGTTVTDSTFTGTSMTHAGYLWNYSTGATQTAQFDNLRVTAVPEATATLPAAALGFAVLLHRRKRKTK